MGLHRYLPGRDEVPSVGGSHWGAKTYCSFIVLSPYENNVDVDPKGVAGFVKAVFRWAAPPTQFLITKYNAGGGVTGAETTYPTLAADGYAAFNGMMNAGTFAATYPDAYVGGLANFASATTNNVSVNVDFASSITLPDAGLQILANVDPSAAKYYEGRWATFNIGGQASVKHMQTDSSTTHSTKYGVPETATIALSAHRAWKAGLIAARPVPRRCSSALAMQSAFLTGSPAGKCDDGVGIAAIEVVKSARHELLRRHGLRSRHDVDEGARRQPRCGECLHGRLTCLQQRLSLCSPPPCR